VQLPVHEDSTTGMVPGVSITTRVNQQHKADAMTYETVGNVIRFVNIRTKLEHHRRVFAGLQQTFHHFSTVLNAQYIQLGQLLGLLTTLLRCRTSRLVCVVSATTSQPHHNQHYSHLTTHFVLHKSPGLFLPVTSYTQLHYTSSSFYTRHCIFQDYMKLLVFWWHLLHLPKQVPRDVDCESIHTVRPIH